jgi:hypothetical protein
MRTTAIQLGGSLAGKLSRKLSSIKLSSSASTLPFEPGPCARREAIWLSWYQQGVCDVSDGASVFSSFKCRTYISYCGAATLRVDGHQTKQEHKRGVSLSVCPL